MYFFAIPGELFSSSFSSPFTFPKLSLSNHAQFLTQTKYFPPQKCLTLSTSFTEQKLFFIFLLLLQRQNIFPFPENFLLHITFQSFTYSFLLSFVISFSFFYNRRNIFPFQKIFFLQSPLWSCPYAISFTNQTFFPFSYPFMDQILSSSSLFSFRDQIFDLSLSEMGTDVPIA